MLPSRAAIAVFLSLATLRCGGAPEGATRGDDLSGAPESLETFETKGTGYFPDGSVLEGGFVDRRGKPLLTLQAFLAGGAAYVSVAMDSTAFAYGTRLRIRELDAKFGRAIEFRVVDTGGAFAGKGRSRMDICTANSKASLDPTINGTLNVELLPDPSVP